jgi:hypothetical protein
MAAGFGGNDAAELRPHTARDSICAIALIEGCQNIRHTDRFAIITPDEPFDPMPPITPGSKP